MPLVPKIQMHSNACLKKNPFNPMRCHAKLLHYLSYRPSSKALRSDAYLTIPVEDKSSYNASSRSLSSKSCSLKLGSQFDFLLNSVCYSLLHVETYVLRSLFAHIILHLPLGFLHSHLLLLWRSRSPNIRTPWNTGHAISLILSRRYILVRCVTLCGKNIEF